MSVQEYRIPDLLRNWPWSRRLSPYYAEAKSESSAWVHSFHPFAGKGQRAFDACDLNLLASLTYPHRSRDFVRLGCDLMNFYFVYDEYTDVSEPAVAAHLAKLVIEAMKDPEKPQERSHLLSEMTRQFWKSARTHVSPESYCLKHFIDTSEKYLNAVTQEATDRAYGRLRTIEEYLPLRRDTCGARPTLSLIEFGLDLSEDIIEHPVIAALTDAAVDMIVFVNDMHSYLRESSSGLSDHNLISVIMNERNVDLQTAFDILGAYSDNTVARFFSLLRELPTWDSDIDLRIQRYIDGLGQWVRGNDDWSCEGKRYYGDDGLRIRDSRVVRICPVKGNYLQEEDVKNSVMKGSKVGSPPRWNLKFQTLWCSFALASKNFSVRFTSLGHRI